jgi:hypothetical protein
MAWRLPLVTLILVVLIGIKVTVSLVLISGGSFLLYVTTDDVRWNKFADAKQRGSASYGVRFGARGPSRGSRPGPIGRVVIFGVGTGMLVGGGWIAWTVIRGLRVSGGQRSLH